MTASERREVTDDFIAIVAARLALSGRERGASAPVIYFVQADTDGPIKIGTTTQLEQRLAALSNSDPAKLHLLATMPGDNKDEAQLHKRFRRLRLHGEWFAPDAELRDFIAGLAR